MIELPCPNDELRATMLQEFLIIDHKYRESLVDLDANYLHMIRLIILRRFLFLDHFIHSVRRTGDGISLNMNYLFISMKCIQLI